MPQKTEKGDSGFASLLLDSRLQRVLASMKFEKPTPIQVRLIPLALEGKDIVAQAKTGSGKTFAYAIPLVELILRRKSSSAESTISSLILVPTKELAEQVTKHITELIVFCRNAVKVVNLSQSLSEAMQKVQIAEKPDILVCTPSRAVSHIEKNANLLSTIQHMVLDEADLLLSFGYENDLSLLSKAMRAECQKILTSATMNADIGQVKSLLSENPVYVKLDDKDETQQLRQFYVRCSSEDRFLLLYVILKLKLINGKTIIFVNDVNSGYHLRLFLEQFGIKTCVLNSQLPISSRTHIVEEFQKAAFNILIATEECHLTVSDGKRVESSTVPLKRKRSKGGDKESGVIRGVDFQNVSCVINFDLPKSAKSYIHRVGRTGRAGKAGMAISFVVIASAVSKNKKFERGHETDEGILKNIQQSQDELGNKLSPYAFHMSQVNAFRYRMQDALRAVTQSAVTEARIKEVSNELLASTKLKRHFEEYPEDLQHLRHDKELRTASTQQHLKNVPSYLLPEGTWAQRIDSGPTSMRKTSENRVRKARRRTKAGNRRSRRDPLRGANRRK